MPTTSFDIEEGQWAQVIHPNMEGTIRYSSGIEEILLVKATTAPPFEDLSDAPAMFTPLVGDKHRIKIVGESIWVASPKDAATIVVTLTEPETAQLPQPVVFPSNFTNKTGETYTLRADGLFYDSLEWFKDNVATGNTSNELVQSWDNNELGDYFIRFTNATGTTDSPTFTISPPVGVPTITTQPTDKTLSSGATLTLVSDATNWDSVQWFFNGILASSGAQTLVVNNVTPANTGTYQAVYTNQFGVMPTDKVTVTVS